jgi:hypothetical protein
MTNPVTVLSWIHLHQWALVIAFFAGLGVRLAKADTQLPAQVPAWLRPHLALLLSAVGACTVAILGGMPWPSALEQTFEAFAIATLGHQTVIEGLRKGKELPVPFGLTKPAPALPSPLPDEPPDPPTPPSLGA